MVVAEQYGLGSNGLSSSGSPLVYPFWPVMTSYTNAYTNTSEKVYLLYATNNSTRANEATNFVPRTLWAAATNADERFASNHWVLIVSPGDSNLMGRVKYLILNCSGLLDANFVGGADRGIGTNPSELAIDSMPEMMGNRDVFIANRATDVRYETQAELAELNKTVFNGAPSNFCVYSYCPAGYWDTVSGTVRTQVNLAGTAGDIYDRRIQITDALTNVNFSSSEAYVIWRNLVDYVDLDSVPTNLTTGVEAVPMINEIVFQCVSGPEPPVNTKTLSVRYELWFPFVAGGGTFSFNGQVSFNSTPPCTTATVSNNFVISSAGFKEIGPFTATTTDSGPFVPTIVQAEVTCSGTKVDELAANSTLNNISIVNDASSPVSLECLDPRLNKDLVDLAYWRLAAAPTLGVTNTWATEWWQANPDGDTNSEMYIANRPLLSVAELGYLVYTNAPWQTVKLYGPNLHRVLDVFGISTNTSDIFIMNTTVYRGLVNCNSNVETDATAVIFAGMPVDQYPGGPVLHPVSMPEAREVTTNIFHGGIFTNLSDIGRNMTCFPGATTELERESFFRNAFNLLNLRQNLFTIIIEAHVASGGNIPRNPVRQRAVALVWRDPYTGEMFIRQIKWLRD
ncbi:MAG: hypothetical protein L6437_16515 [Kiritimatiellae bacterium]|nr:hypothetical protein [Kiritimatiellia bacterium]